MATKIDNFSLEEIKNFVKESHSFTEVGKKIGYKNTGGNVITNLKKYFNSNNIDYSHFNKTRNHFVKRTFDNVFIKDSTVDQTTLKKWYLNGNYSKYKCKICGINTWNNQELVLRLDHINGNNHDNRLENLRWLCPNCDSQTEFYCGKNRPLKQKEKNFCIDCGKEIKDLRSKRCKECSNKAQRVCEWPSRKQLKEMIRTESFTAIGKKYNVSDNAVKKWCDKYHLPRLKSEISKYSKEEWDLI